MPCEMPEPPKEGFFKGLFGGGVRPLDREELCTSLKIKFIFVFTVILFLLLLLQLVSQRAKPVGALLATSQDQPLTWRI